MILSQYIGLQVIYTPNQRAFEGILKLQRKKSNSLIKQNLTNFVIGMISEHKIPVESILSLVFYNMQYFT